MIEYIDKQSLLKYLEENWPENWTDSESEAQEQFDWRQFYDTVADFVSIDPGETEEDSVTYAEIGIDSYFDPEQFYDLIVEGTAQCCICEHPFPVGYNTIEFNESGDETGRWISEDRIFELENQTVRDLKKKVISWNFCPGCGRKIKGYCGEEKGTLESDDVLRQD